MMKLYKYAIIAAGLMIGTACSGDFLDADNTGYLDSETAADLASKDPESLNAYLRGTWAFMVQYNIMSATSGSHDDVSYMSILHSTDMMVETIAMLWSHWFGNDYEFDNRMQN